MNKDELIKLIDERLDKKAASFTNANVSQHYHTGGDSPRIPVNNTVIEPNFGIQFNNGTTTKYQMYIIDPENGSGLVIEPNTARFGGSTGIFYIGGGYKFNENFGAIRLQAGSGSDAVTASVESNIFRLSTSGDFALKLPDTTKPASPLPGMIAFEGTEFYGCRTAGVWEKFTLVP